MEFYINMDHLEKFCTLNTYMHKNRTMDVKKLEVADGAGKSEKVSVNAGYYGVQPSQIKLRE